jgi:hypothetical protein
MELQAKLGQTSCFKFVYEKNSQGRINDVVGRFQALANSAATTETEASAGAI